MNQTHLVVIVADQLRYDVLGKGFTPNIDSIAAQGVTFDRCYCASPLCVPARGALFTGLCPNTNGSRINPWYKGDAAAGYVHKGIPTLYGLMEASGRDCIHSGKQHLFIEGGQPEDDPNTKIRWMSSERSYKAYLAQNGRRAPGGQRFRTLVPEMGSGRYTRARSYSNPETGCYTEGAPYYFDNYFTECALQGLRERDTTKPLFLSAMFLAPHPPLEIPEPWYSYVKPEDVKLPENVGHWYPYQSPLQMYNLTGVVGSHYRLDQWKESWRVYLGLLHLLDDCVGRLLDELKRQGIYDDSLIVFTSDHGEMLGSHRLFQKMCMYEESAHTPLYMHLPKGAHAGTHISETVSHLDILPTLCGYLGIEAPPCEGQSLVPLVEGTEEPGKTWEEKDVFIQFDGNGALGNFQRCIVHGGCKLIADIFKDEVYFELYDTIADPQETRNLLFEEEIPEIARTMLQSLMEHMAETHDDITLPNADLDRFVAEYRNFAAPKEG